MSALPGILADVEEAAGQAAALQLAREFGGTQISLSAAKSSALVRVVGLDAARKIVQKLGRGRVMVPMANLRGQRARRAAATRMFAGGASARDVALACDIHERTAWRAKTPPKPKGDLFNED